MRVHELIAGFISGTFIGKGEGSVRVTDAGVGAHSALFSYDEPIAVRTPRGVFIVERPSPELRWSPTTRQHLAWVRSCATEQRVRVIRAEREEVREMLSLDPDEPADGVQVPGNRVTRDRYGRQMSFNEAVA